MEFKLTLFSQFSSTTLGLLDPRVIFLSRALSELIPVDFLYSPSISWGMRRGRHIPRGDRKPGPSLGSGWLGASVRKCRFEGRTC